MSEQSVGSYFHEPQYLDEVEMLVGEPAFDDPDLRNRLYEDFYSVPEEQLMARSLLYTRALRIVAETRRGERQRARETKAQFDAQRWNNGWRITTKRIGQIAADHEQEVSVMASELQMRKRVVDRLTTTDVYADLRTNQPPYIQDILDFLQAGPRTFKQTGEGKPQPHIADGALVECPTGGGKTVMMARALTVLGAGAHCRALVVVPSLQLADQLSGKVGSGDFVRFLPPNASISAVTGAQKKFNGDVVLTTIDSFIAHFTPEVLKREGFNIAVVDEAHHLNEPAFQKAFIERWQGPVLGFTATPEYSPEKDVRDLFPVHIKHGNLAEYTDRGWLNDAELLLFKILPEKYAQELPDGIDLQDPITYRAVGRELADNSAIEFVLPLLEEGRRGIIFCQQGDESALARRLAERLNNLKNPDTSPIILPDGKQLHAEALGSFRGNSRRDGNKTILKDFAEGKVQILTSVDYGIEGLDADIDFVVINCNVSSSLKIRQMVGRGTRKSKRFPKTIYAQFLAPTAKQNLFTVRTLYDAFEGDVVEVYSRSSYNFGPRRPSDFSWTDRLPPALRGSLIGFNDQVLSKADIGQAVSEPIPENYTPLHRLITNTGYSESYAKVLALRAGYKWIGRKEIIAGTVKFVRYYEPAAQEFFASKVIETRRTADLVTIRTFARMCQVGRTFMQGLVDELSNSKQLKVHFRRSANGVYAMHLDAASQSFVRERIGQLPVQASGDMTVARLAAELRAQSLKVGQAAIRTQMAKAGIQTENKRLVEGRGFAPFLSASDVAALWQTFKKMEHAQPTDLTIPKILQLAGFSPKIHPEFSRWVKQENIERGRTKIVESQRTVKYAECYDQSTGEDVARRFAAWVAQHRVSLEPGLLPLNAATALINVGEGTIRRYFRMAERTLRKVALRGAPRSLCLTWNDIQELIGRYGLREGAPAIDFHRLQKAGANPQHRAYAQAIQVLLFDEARLGLSDEELAAARKLAAKEFPRYRPRSA